MSYIPTKEDIADTEDSATKGEPERWALPRQVTNAERPFDAETNRRVSELVTEIGSLTIHIGQWIQSLQLAANTRRDPYAPGQVLAVQGALDDLQERVIVVGNEALTWTSDDGPRVVSTLEAIRGDCQEQLSKISANHSVTPPRVGPPMRHPMADMNHQRRGGSGHWGSWYSGPGYGRGGSPAHGHGGSPGSWRGGSPTHGHGSSPSYGRGGSPGYGRGGSPAHGRGGSSGYGRGGSPSRARGGNSGHGRGGGDPGSERRGD